LEAPIADGIPGASFAVDEVPREVERLTSLEVTVNQGTVIMGRVSTAVLEGTCGDLVQIASYQLSASRDIT
jgi:hypothetical protein